MFGWVDLRIDEGVDSLNGIEADMVSDYGKTSEEYLLKSSVAQKDIWNNLHLKESILNQKSG